MVTQGESLQVLRVRGRKNEFDRSQLCVSQASHVEQYPFMCYKAKQIGPLHS